jgi:hypothetical protein
LPSTCEVVTLPYRTVLAHRPYDLNRSVNLVRPVIFALYLLAAFDSLTASATCAAIINVQREALGGATLTEGLEDAGLQAADFSDPGEALRPLETTILPMWVVTHVGLDSATNGFNVAVAALKPLAVGSNYSDQWAICRSYGATL